MNQLWNNFFLLLWIKSISCHCGSYHSLEFFNSYAIILTALDDAIRSSVVAFLIRKRDVEKELYCTYGESQIYNKDNTAKLHYFKSTIIIAILLMTNTL